MGLDIYLRRCENLQEQIALQEQAEAFSEQCWAESGKEYDQYTDEEKDAVRAKVKAEYERLGLDNYGSSTKIESIELDSALYPEHMFKVGYLRSSYNSGGINSVMERAGCPSLYDIFKPSGDDYYVTPDWEACLVRAEQAIAQYREFLTGPMGAFDVMEVRNPIFEGVDSPKKALELFASQLETYQSRKATDPNAWASYSNREGEYFLEGRKVFGFIPNSGWGKGFHVIVGKEASEEVQDDWYYQALLVTKETIAYVLSRPVEDQKNYFVAWSG